MSLPMPTVELPARALRPPARPRPQPPGCGRPARTPGMPTDLAGGHPPAASAQPALPAAPARPAAVVPDRTQQRLRHWPAVQRGLGTLPTPLLQRAMLLCQDMARQLGDGSGPHGLLTRPWDAPLFDQPGWLLDDWDVRPSAARDTFESGLFVATAFSLLASRVRSSRLDPQRGADAADAPLQQALADLAATHWQALFSADSPFWDHHRRAWQAAVTADAAQAPAACGATLPADGQLAWLPLPAVAAALWAGHAGAVPLLCRCNALCAAVLQTVAHLASHRQDVVNGRPNPTLQRALDAMPAGPRGMPGVADAQAALLLTGTLGRVLRENEQRLAELRALAGDLRLPGLQAHADGLVLLMQQLRSLFGLKAAGTRALPALHGFFLPATDRLDQALASAEAWLRDSPILRGPWPDRPPPAAGVPRSAGGLFAAGLVVEVLGAHGHAMATPALQLLDALQSRGPCRPAQRLAQPPTPLADADDLALALRLAGLAQRPLHDRDTLVVSALAHAGQLPGTPCATAQASLLLQLTDAAWSAHHAAVQAAAQHWCSRWLAVGLGGCERYPPMYSLWTATELVSRLQARATDSRLRVQLRQVLALLSQRLDAEARRGDLGAQDAALLLLASLRARALPVDPAWVQLLCRHQQPDGSWPGEPIQLAPLADAAGAGWIGSQAVTTALAFHALQHHQAGRRAAP